MGFFSKFSGSETIGKAKGCLGSLSSILSDEQRASIILLLMEVANSNDVVNKSENNLIHAVLNFLSIASKEDSNIKGQKVLKSITDKLEIDEAIEKLKDIDVFQKREILIWLAAIYHLDSQNKRSGNIIHMAASAFGFSIDTFVQKEQEIILEFINNFK